MDNKSCCSATHGAEQKKDGCCSTGQKGSSVDIVVKGMFVGAIVMFLYLSASWFLIPWHKATIHSFKNDKAVATALLKNAPESGIYVLPAHQSAEAGQKQAAKAAVDKPFAFVSVLTEGFDCPKNMKVLLLKQFVLCLMLSALLTSLLRQKCCSVCPIAYSARIGALVALAHVVPGAIWFHFPATFSLIAAIDDVLSVMLAGFVISKCALKNGSLCNCK